VAYSIGWKDVEEPPPLSTEFELQALIGKMILYGHGSQEVTGWFIGSVQSRNVTATDLKKAPTHSQVVKYDGKPDR